MRQHPEFADMSRECQSATADAFRKLARFPFDLRGDLGDRPAGGGHVVSRAGNRSRQGIRGHIADLFVFLRRVATGRS